MDLTIAQHQAKIDKLSKYAENKPNRYLAKVIFLALLGYLYIFVLFIVALALLTLVVAATIYSPNRGTLQLLVFIGIPALLIIWGIANALWIKFDPPEGEELLKDDFPELFERIENIRRTLDAPKIHHVILTNELNAAIVGIPRLGIPPAAPCSVLILLMNF